MATLLSQLVWSVIHKPVTYDPEVELEQMQMPQTLVWMALIFDTSDAFKHELHNVYRTIHSDYKQYLACKAYNATAWWKKDTKALATKIVRGMKLFQEGVRLYTAYRPTTGPTHETKAAATQAKVSPASGPQSDDEGPVES